MMLTHKTYVRTCGVDAAGHESIRVALVPVERRKRRAVLTVLVVVEKNLHRGVAAIFGYVPDAKVVPGGR